MMDAIAAELAKRGKAPSSALSQQQQHQQQHGKEDGDDEARRRKREKKQKKAKAEKKRQRDQERAAAAHGGASSSSDEGGGTVGAAAAAAAPAAAAAAAAAAAEGEDFGGAQSGQKPRKRHRARDAVSTRDVVVGQGFEAVAEGSRVRVLYCGKLLPGGRVFDRNDTSGKALQFVVGDEEVIEGFEDGVLGMRVGGERVIEVPPSLAYGDSPPPGLDIPPGARLQFTVTLIGFY